MVSAEFVNMVEGFSEYEERQWWNLSSVVWVSV